MNNESKIDLMRKIVETTDGKIATVTFVKKDGTVREMQFRTGVTAGLVENPRICINGTSNTTAHIPKYINVFDMVQAREETKIALANGATPAEAKEIAAKKSYRKINLSTVTHFKCGPLELTFDR